MADGYWNRQAPISASASASAMAVGYWNQQPPLNPTAASLPKRPSPDYDLPVGAPSGHELHNYLTQVDDHTRPHSLKDTNFIGVSYDRYLQNSKLPSFGEPARMGAPGSVGPNVASNVRNMGYDGQVPLDPMVRSHPNAASDVRNMGHDGQVPLDSTVRSHPNVASNVRNMGYDGQVSLDPMVRSSHETSLPPDATCTLFVEGLPPDSTQREVAHIFRPFVGFKEIRLVNKEPKYKGGGPLILCFVDFTTPGCAASALGAMQGYKFDEEDPDSPILRVQFARFPTRKSGPPRRKW